MTPEQREEIYFALSRITEVLDTIPSGPSEKTPCTGVLNTIPDDPSERTPCTELRYKVGDRFVVLVGKDNFLPVGTIITLTEDDATEIPRFVVDFNPDPDSYDRGSAVYQSLASIAKIPDPYVGVNNVVTR
jgi:hypothetical protein